MKYSRSKFTIRFTPFTTHKRFNNETDQLVFRCEEQKERQTTANTSASATTDGLTALDAAWNVTNAIQVESLF